MVYESLPRYSSADGDCYFGWANMKRITPLVLAKKFIVEFPKFAEQGKHPDPAYARWFADMLKQTVPVGVVTAFGDREPPVDRMLTEFCSDRVVVPLPPVGLVLAPGRESGRHCQFERRGHGLDERHRQFRSQKNRRARHRPLGHGSLNLFKDLPAEGVLFPYLSRVRAGDRVTEFGQRCRQHGIKGVTLHSYRYAWAERAKTVGYPERFAQEALGHSSKAVHRAYAKRALMKIPSLEDYEQRTAAKVEPAS